MSRHDHEDGPNADDVVQLVIILKGGAHVLGPLMTRQEASSHIRMWHSARMDAFCRIPDDLPEEQKKASQLHQANARELLEGGTALLYTGSRNDRKVEYASMAWVLSEVVAMVVQDVMADDREPWQEDD